jgi:phenylpropionate dioxygenase-like ring-hydroxylating dioxygenase large terminal subunit
MPLPPSEIRALVREDAIHSSVYTDPRLFELEMQRLFGRSWILLGHHSEIPAGGDYVTRRIGRTPLIVARGADGSIRAFHNRCRHRGARLCTLPRGTADPFVCPYHGWSFAADGRLLTVPAPEEYPPSFRLEEHPLEPIARVELYRGFIFGSLASDGATLLDFLGHIRTSFDDLVDRAPADDVEVTPTVLRHRYRGNWKLGFENLNDTIHAGIAHGAAIRAAKKVLAEMPDPAAQPELPMTLANSKPLAYFRDLGMVTENAGHSYIGGHMGMEYRGDSQSAYFRALAAARGEARARDILATERHVTLIYPSATMHSRYQVVRLVQPLAPDLTETIGFIFRLKGAPTASLDLALVYGHAATSAWSNVITDDLELYESIQRTSTQTPAWLPISRGADGGGRGVDRGPRANRHTGTSEAFIRNQYRRWCEALARP